MKITDKNLIRRVQILDITMMCLLYIIQACIFGYVMSYLTDKGLTTGQIGFLSAGFGALADLELSGHIHAGQFFPVKLIYTLAGLHVEGEYPVGDTVLLVSPGIAGWYLPLRNESVCGYEVIDLQPE